MTDKACSAGAATGAPRRRFNLKYAGRLGKFIHLAGDDPINQLRFLADQGILALEDSYMQRRPVELQEQLARTMQQLGMEMGTFIATADFTRPTFTSGDAALRHQVLAEMRAAVEAAKRLHARWFTVVPGTVHPSLPWDHQTANLIETLRYCCDICEPAGMVMLIEPLNTAVDHPGMFLTRISQAYQICRAVDRPSCKILDDFYHQQITEGDLTGNLDRAWDEIAYIQVGDHPGRNEPATGEINYKNIFGHLYRKGYQGLIGMEHGQSRPGPEGEQAVIDAYVEVDHDGAGFA
jgi:hydroxypyruvate isomerase